jgi:hypothetical protein
VGFTDPNMRLALTVHGAGADRLGTCANRHWTVSAPGWSVAQEVGAARALTTLAVSSVLGGGWQVMGV